MCASGYCERTNARPSRRRFVGVTGTIVSEGIAGFEKRVLPLERGEHRRGIRRDAGNRGGRQPLACGEGALIASIHGGTKARDWKIQNVRIIRTVAVVPARGRLQPGR